MIINQKLLINPHGIIHRVNEKVDSYSILTPFSKSKFKNVTVESLRLKAWGRIVPKSGV